MAEAAGETVREAVGVFHDAGSFQNAVEDLLKAGFDRSETPFPIGYPTAARPQAWAAGTPLLLLRLLLGLEPDTAHGRLGTLPGVEPLDRATLSLAGVRALGRSWDVTSSPSGISIEAVA